MPIGKHVGEFSVTSTSVTNSTSTSGELLQIVNVEGTATGYGTVLGTVTFHPDAPGVQSGKVAWVGTGYLENGEMVGGTGSGVFEQSAKHRWRVRVIMRISDGTVLLSDGELLLEGRTYRGSMYKWE